MMHKGRPREGRVSEYVLSDFPFVVVPSGNITKGGKGSMIDYKSNRYQID